MSHIKGIIPVIITPLNRDLKIDKVALENLCLKYKQCSVEALWVLGTGGEDMCLSFDDRVEVTNIVSDIVGSDIKLIVGCSFFSPKESYEFIDITSDLKIDSYHAMPYHQKVSLSQLEEWYLQIANYSKLPLWLYTSGNWAQRMSPEFIKNMKRHPNIKGVKYSSSNIIDLQGAIELQDENFQVITAVVKSLYSCLCLGINAATTVEANLFYKNIYQIYDLYKNRLYLDALEKQKYLNSTLLNYPSPATKDNFLRIAEIKYFMSLRDDSKKYTTAYYRTVSDIEETELNNFYEKFKNEFNW